MKYRPQPVVESATKIPALCWASYFSLPAVSFPPFAPKPEQPIFFLVAIVVFLSAVVSTKHRGRPGGAIEWNLLVTHFADYAKLYFVLFSISLLLVAFVKLLAFVFGFAAHLPPR